MSENWKEECWTKERKLAPFNKKTGSLESYYLTHQSELREVSHDFSATLVLHDFDKGWRSAHRIVWIEQDTGKTYPMFVGKFMELVRYFRNEPLRTFPRVDGLWRVCKRGANYGIELIEAL